MGTPTGNGLVEIAGEKQAKERGFNCMQLIKFLSEDIANGGDNSWEYWHGRHIEASNGNCAYKAVCPVHDRTIKRIMKRGHQFSLF